MKNEIDACSGKFGWCICCRNPAQLYCKDTRYPVCSYECKLRIVNLLDAVDSGSKTSVPQLYQTEEIKRHVQDAVMIFKSICKMFNKSESSSTMSSYTLKSQIMGLELILNVVNNPGPALIQRQEFIKIVKTLLCDGLLKHCVSNEQTIFALSVSIFHALFVNFRQHLKN